MTQDTRLKCERCRFHVGLLLNAKAGSGAGHQMVCRDCFEKTATPEAKRVIARDHGAKVLN